MSEISTNEAQTAPLSNGAGIKKESQGSLLGYTVVALGLALFIRFFIAEPYLVSGQSMEPNFHDHQYLIVDRISYDIGEPKRGDIVIFGLPGNTSRRLIKRVIGLPGETVVLSGSNVSIINAENPEGFTLSEPYLEPENLGGATDMRIILEEDEFVVLGDNRRVSSDSRVWGALPREDIVGRVLFRLYPFNQIAILPAHSTYTANSPESAEEN
ncbi:signal peptidase I [Candidatus Kaiserbacteria bacterium CG10_big_fil_rev_8_21_14_0_10_51_14]|uniref:Signal peptidase I n=1 Tax=Candidatus Kaiserbacteria bacterium CG10_big_fil_rev_8_21_14_0_10_51_14 TaxID=1974610 RepID=A0A2H0UBB1_9BACT|nr:MAG: signal peptidase I [Candidatus Kaiserbacteria bacterium CG10_big_fil_rev_8_21_14_0_10_51_14]